MDNRDALIRAIIDHPEDDLPRLVFADWLEEHGAALRAEFIRAQIELTQLQFDEKRRVDQTHRVYSLTQQLESELKAEFPIGLRRIDHWERGFAASAIWSAQAILETKQSAAVVPPTRVQIFVDVPPRELPQVFASPLLFGVQELRFAGEPIGDLGAAALAQATNLSRLRRLSLNYQRIQDVGANALAQSPCLENVIEVFFSGNWISRSMRIALRSRFGVVQI